MRTLRRNKQKLYYSLYKDSEPHYVLDEDGNRIISYVDEDGNIYYLEDGVEDPSYTTPVMFYGNIAMSGGESEAVEYGLDLSQYSAVLIVAKGTIPIDETSLIWHETEPIINEDGTADEHSADYKVVKISPSLNFDKYVLQKVVK